jgi:competence protein ComEA
MSLRLPPGWALPALLLIPPLIAAGALAAVWLFGGGAAPAPADTVPAALSLVAPAPAPGLLVYVSGAVAHPGLYRLPRGQRASDAIAAAGGLLPSADATRMPNLAERLRDGMQIKVAFAKGAAGGVSSGKLDLNGATLAELESVPGFSEALAQAAIAYRDSYGGFAATRELVTVLGMAEADYQIAKQYVKV